MSVAFAIAATLATGVAVGLWPAIRMSRVDPAVDLRGLGRASGASRIATECNSAVATASTSEMATSAANSDPLLVLRND